MTQPYHAYYRRGILDGRDDPQFSDSVTLHELALERLSIQDALQHVRYAWRHRNAFAVLVDREPHVYIWIGIASSELDALHAAADAAWPDRRDADGHLIDRVQAILYTADDDDDTWRRGDHWALTGRSDCSATVKALPDAADDISGLTRYYRVHQLDLSDGTHWILPYHVWYGPAISLSDAVRRCRVALPHLKNNALYPERALEPIARPRDSGPGQRLTVVDILTDEDVWIGEAASGSEACLKAELEAELITDEATNYILCDEEMDAEYVVYDAESEICGLFRRVK